MKTITKKKNIIFIVLFASLVVIDYFNIPSYFGFSMPNINHDFWIGILNIIVIISLYIITYKKIDEKAIEREKNKYSISVLLFQECYNECKTYLKILDQETVEKYIVPKMDFNSTDNTIINNLQTAPFISENIIMDFVKDGHVTKAQIEGYFRVREKYRQYINMRIIFFDNIHMYESQKADLDKVIDSEIKKLHT